MAEKNCRFRYKKSCDGDQETLEMTDRKTKQLRTRRNLLENGEAKERLEPLRVEAWSVNGNRILPINKKKNKSHQIHPPQLTLHWSLLPS